MEVKGDKMPFLVFLRETVQQLLKTHGQSRVRPGPMLQIRGGARDSIRRDERGHWIAHTAAQKLRCKLCAGRYVLYSNVLYSNVLYCTGVNSSARNVTLDSTLNVSRTGTPVRERLGGGDL